MEKSRPTRGDELAVNSAVAMLYIYTTVLVF